MSTNAPPESSPPPAAPTVAGVPVRPTWAMVLYVLLVVAAALALVAQRSPAVDPGLSAAAPWVFLVFALGFAVYRVALVVARKYSPFKAFTQLFVAALFFVLLLVPRARTASAEGLLGHSQPEVRAQAAELAGWRGQVEAAPALVRRLSDASPAVREAAHGALVKLNGGVDLGPAGDEAARKAWEARFP